MNKLRNVMMATVMLCACGFYTVSCGSKSDSGGGGNNPPPGDACATVQAKFAANVSPIIQASCAGSGCHSFGHSGTQPTWFATDGTVDAAVVIANAAAINSAVQAGTMPKTGSLTAAQKAIIKCWVTNGAKND